MRMEALLFDADSIQGVEDTKDYFFHTPTLIFQSASGIYELSSFNFNFSLIYPILF
jgi:hypothetical protein